MNRLSKTFLGVGFIALIFYSCNKPVSGPEDRSVRFTFDFQYMNSSQSTFLFTPRGDRMAVPVGKAAGIQAIDLVRVMVFDFSAYGSWTEMTQSQWWQEYAREREGWTGNQQSWAEWKKFFGDHMNIVSDQTLDIRGQEAVGTVNGVQGLNGIVVGLIQNNVIQYMGEGSGMGVEGETHEVEIQVYSISGSGNTLEVSTVGINPDSTLVFSSQTQQFVCAVRYSDWSYDTLTSQVTWSVSPGTLGSVNSNGQFQAGSGGDGIETLRVSYRGKQATAKIKIVQGIPGDMVLISAGSFLMGKNSTSGTSDTHPAHTVNLDAFYIDRFSVTCAQYAAYLNAAIKSGKVQMSAGNVVKDGHILFSTLSTGQLQYVNGQFLVVSGMDNFPMIRVSWWGADAYAAHYNKRLPTEAEWEKAARGTDGREYPWGNTPPTPALCNYSWYLKPVGWYHPLGDSPYGLSDMAGNAYQWVNDWYSDTYYTTSPTNNPKGPTTGTEKVLRGGDAFSYYYFLYCYCRGRNPIDEHRQIFGFRCAKSP